MTIFNKLVGLAGVLTACITSLPAIEIDPNTGIWVGNDVDHFLDEKLAYAIADFFQEVQAESIVDFGCGAQGKYVKILESEGLWVDGYDGNPAVVELTQGRCHQLDLSKTANLGKQYDWVLSLETGEHIPKRFEKIFIENLIRHCKTGIVLSWAVKGQGGGGHFNEQNNDYVKKVMASYGFVSDIEKEKQLRAQSTLPWFRNTVMVFYKKNK